MHPTAWKQNVSHLAFLKVTKQNYRVRSSSWDLYCPSCKSFRIPFLFPNIFMIQRLFN